MMRLICFTNDNFAIGLQPNILSLVDVVLEGNQSDTKYLGDSTVSTAALAVGSNLKGYSNVKNLDIAMTGDATLLAQVTAFNTLAPTTSWAVLRGAVDDIVCAVGNDNSCYLDVARAAA